MKILLFQFPLQPSLGGAETHTLSLMRGLVDKGDSVWAVCSNQSLAAALKQKGIRAHQLWCGWEPTSIPALLLFPLTLAIAAPVFLFFLLIFRPQYIACLTLTDKLLATPLARLCGSRVIWIEHTRLGRWLFASPLRPWFVLNSHLATVVTHSYFLRNQLLRLGVAIDRVKVIYPGTPLPVPASPRPKTPGLVIGYLGRLASEKGVEVLLKAVAGSIDPQAPRQNSDRLQNPTLLIAGSGPAETPLKNLADNLGLRGRAIFLGTINNKAEFFSRVDCVVVPSVEAESFGLTIIEAMAAKVPVIASKIGAIPEIIEHKKTGLLCLPGDERSIIECLNWLFADDDRRQQMIAAASNSVHGRFTEQKMLEAYRAMIFQR